MSWSRSVTGTKDEVLNEAATWPGSLSRVEESYGASEQITAGVRRQANAALGAISEHVKEVPDGHELDVTASGHANADGSGEVVIKITEYAAESGEEKPPVTSRPENNEGDVPSPDGSAPTTDPVEDASAVGHGG